MPRVTPTEVLFAARFTLDQADAIKRARAQWWKDNPPRDGGADNFFFEKQDIGEIIWAFARLQANSDVECLQKDATWRDRLRESRFWKDLEARVERANAHIERVLDAMATARAALEAMKDSVADEAIDILCADDFSMVDLPALGQSRN